jgi:hypothetical protein
MNAAARRCGPRFSPLGSWMRVSPEAVRDQIRLAFVRWGIPCRFRVDNGFPWGSRGDFSTELALWLIGLGVGMHWNNAGSPQENGVVERSQGTANRWCEPWTCRTPAELQERWVRRDHMDREVYPYRDRRSRLATFPGLAHSGRHYDQQSETTLWDWSRVAEHLAGIVPLRRVDQSGRVSVYNHNHYVGRLHHRKDVYVMYDPDSHEGVFADRDGRQLNRRPAVQLSPERVMSLNVSQR